MKNEDIICISSIDWDFIWQGHQEIMSTLASQGNRVIFIENTGVRSPNLQDIPRLKKRIQNWFHSVKGIRQIKENLYVHSPIILPFPYSRIARWINGHFLISALKKWVKSVGFSNPVIWTFLPTGLVLDIIDAIDNKLVVYYCIDNFAASSPGAKRIIKSERKLLKRADIVFVTAKNLRDSCAEYNKNVHIFPYGVNMDVYNKARHGNMPQPEDMGSIRRPIVGYVGGVHKWIDVELVKFLASDNPDKSFVFVGPLQRNIDELKNVKNVYFLGQKKYSDLPSYVAQFDAGIIPYLITDYTKNVYPTKINEYLSLGKPVISTEIPEVLAFNERNGGIVYTGKLKEDISSAIKSAAAEKPERSVSDKRISIADKEGSWETKIAGMCELIDKEMDRKEAERSLRWKDNILKLYKRSGRRMVISVGAILAGYLLLFHTPLIWIVGKPLKVSSPLEKSDMMVVLAGGVGESGKVGQGYEERVQYAVELYKKGYAPRMIFSSGFQYAVKEAEIMKALAVSLGVPASAIILEENANSTYQSFDLSRKILLANKAKSAIMISSPYNMLRLSLVARKANSPMYFVYAPIPRSIFFSDGKTVELKHIVAILHEYIGIVYYWFKGYI